MTRPRNVTGALFVEDVLISAKPIIVDFWAEWCGPCRLVSPVLEQLADQHSGKVEVVKVNIDEYPGVASKLGINSIPAHPAVRGRQAVGCRHRCPAQTVPGGRSLRITSANAADIPRPRTGHSGPSSGCRGRPHVMSAVLWAQ